MKNKNYGADTQVMAILGGIFTGIGLIFLLIGICLGVETYLFAKKAQVVEGTITDMVYHHDRYTGDSETSDTQVSVYVSYELDGVSYEVPLNEYSSFMQVGKPILLYVDADNPQRVRVKSLAYLLFAIFGGIGGVFVIAGGILLMIRGKRIRKRRRLRETGQMIYAQAVASGINTHYQLNGRSPYYLELHYQDPMTGERWQFRSGLIWENPEPYIGMQVPVYVNPTNRNEYEVDTAYLAGSRGIYG